MDIPVHNQILFKACANATQKLGLNEDDPRSPILHMPRIARGSWINDMNQASCFFDMTGAPGGKKQFPEQFFHIVWKHDREELLQDLAKWVSPSFAQKAKDKLDPLSASMYDVGTYDERDHLDEPKQQGNDGKPRLEHRSSHHLTKNVERGIYDYVEGDLQYSMISRRMESRLRMENLTILGRSLHTLQDFYSHTNYVELLLWRMAQLGPSYISEAIVKSFNAPPTFDDEPKTKRKKVVLRGPSSPDWKPTDLTFFMYGDEPEATALTGGLFDTLDTIYSIIVIYERHLRAYDQDHSSEDSIISLIFGLVDFPRKDLVRCFIDLYQDFSDLIDSIGDFIRKKALDALEGSLVGRFPDREGDIRAAFEIIDHYDSAVADRAARAGRLNYLRHVIELALLSKFQPGHEGGPWQLPNHSLLQKDYKPESNDQTELLRYNVACSLAVDLSTKILVKYFSGEKDYMDDLQAHLVHPAKHPESFLQQGPVLRIPDLLALDWAHL